MVIVTVGLVIWDFFLTFDGSPDNTISQILSATSKRWWIIAYGWAFVGGHLFIPGVWREPVWLPAVSIIVAVVSIFVLNLRRVSFPRWAAMIIGVLHGWLLWGQ